MPSKSIFLILNTCGRHIFSWSCLSEIPLLVPSSQSVSNCSREIKNFVKGTHSRHNNQLLDCMLKTKTRTMLFFSDQSCPSRTWAASTNPYTCFSWHLIDRVQTTFSTLRNEPTWISLQRNLNIGGQESVEILPLQLSHCDHQELLYCLHKLQDQRLTCTNTLTWW